jgi:hypothetical protein
MNKDHVAHMGYTKNSYIYVEKNLKGKSHLEDLDVHRRKLLNRSYKNGIWYHLNFSVAQSSRVTILKKKLLIYLMQSVSEGLGQTYTTCSGGWKD